MIKRVAFLWDESFLWGLMAYKALKANNLPFELIRSSDIKADKLKYYKMLFVPGGWASNKLKALGEDGINKIRSFVQNGGNYLGFCGGAGLATADGIGLLNIDRIPQKQRVPSFSGRIYININEHPIWEGCKIQDSRFKSKNSELQTPNSKLIFHAWWPSQFFVPPFNKQDSSDNIKILATFSDALPDSFSSDLNVSDVEIYGSWSELESIYKINLNPERLKNTPSVIEGGFGKGKVILSLIHFDTPNDENGATVLKNLWKYLVDEKIIIDTVDKQNRDKENLSCENNQVSEICHLASELINLGIRNFLWFWRNPMLLQWRRGVRGLEYCTLFVMLKELEKVWKNNIKGERLDLKKVKGLLIPFIEKAKRLLMLEKFVMLNRHITPLSISVGDNENDLKIQKLRTELFGNLKSHGGLFKELIDEIDSLLYKFLAF